VTSCNVRCACQRQQHCATATATASATATTTAHQQQQMTTATRSFVSLMLLAPDIVFGHNLHRLHSGSKSELEGSSM